MHAAAYRPQGQGDTLHRNGKTQRSLGDTQTLLGVASEGVGTPAALLGIPSEALGVASEGVGTPAALLGIPSEALGVASEGVGTPSQVLGMLPAAPGTSRHVMGTPSRRPVAAFGANTSIARRLAAAQLTIEAVLADAALLAALSAYGYGAERMAEGKALRDQALALQQQQRARYGDHYSATDAHATAQAQAHLSYTRHRGVARVALRGDRGAAQKLGLHPPRQTTQAGWLLQAQQFYANALADATIPTALAVYNLTRADLAAAQAQLAAVAAGAVARQSLRSAAQETTRARRGLAGAE